jgi:hypothetical protein
MHLPGVNASGRGAHCCYISIRGEFFRERRILQSAIDYRDHAGDSDNLQGPPIPPWSRSGPSAASFRFFDNTGSRLRLLNFTLCSSACGRRCCLDCRRTRFATQLLVEGRRPVDLRRILGAATTNAADCLSSVQAAHLCQRGRDIRRRHAQEVGCSRCRDVGFHRYKCHSFAGSITLRISIAGVRRPAAGRASSLRALLRRSGPT